MKRNPVQVVVGAVVVAVGTVWTLQGLGYLRGSAMTGDTTWAVVGPIVAVVGVLLILRGLRRRRVP